MDATPEPRAKRRLRSMEWFDDPSDCERSALYVERYLNFGLTIDELRSGRPIIGIAQTGSDLSPCNRHHLELAKRVHDGVIAAGGIPFEFPVHPIQETARRPTAALDRNLAYLGLVEILHGYFFDGVVLLTGCDKTTPACLMAAATVDLPAIVLSGGPMTNGWHGGERVGSGCVHWEARKQLIAGGIDQKQFLDVLAATVPSAGHCNTMGTALTMNILAEALGMSLPGCAAIPAPYRERSQMAYETGRRIVDMVWEDLRPSDILTREAFENAITVNSAIGGSTNAPIHLNAIARHAGIELTLADWDRVGTGVPLLADVQPAGRFLAEDFHRAGGLPAVAAELIRADLLHVGCRTVAGRSIGEVFAQAPTLNPEVIRPVADPLMEEAGLMILSGNLFDSAVVKTCVIGKDFRRRNLSNPRDPEAFEGRAIVFDGPEDYRARINDPALAVDRKCILFIRGAGPLGYPGGAEVVNLQPPLSLMERGILSLPCIGDGRQSGTSAAVTVVNAAPEAAAGGGLALLRTGDRVRVDLAARKVDMLVSGEELDARRAHVAAQPDPSPPSQTPWQEIQRSLIGQFDEGMVLRPALRYQRISQSEERLRHNH